MAPTISINVALIVTVPAMAVTGAVFGHKAAISREDAAAMDEINKNLVVELQEQGVAVLSGTVIKGKYVLRAANVNHRSRREDFNILIREVMRIGKELHARISTPNC